MLDQVFVVVIGSVLSVASIGGLVISLFKNGSGEVHAHKNKPAKLAKG